MEGSRNNRIVITIGLIGFVTLLAFQNCSHARINDSGSMSESLPAETQIEESGILNTNDVLLEVDPEPIQANQE